MKIVNIVCAGDLKQPISFDLVFNSRDNRFLYDPEMYHGGYVKLSNAKVTIYRSGKYIIVGVKSLEDIKSAFDELIVALSPYIDPDVVEEPRVSNIVALKNYGRKIDFSSLQEYFREYDIDYEPEQFPGLILHCKSCTALIFSTGKVIVTGAKTMSQLNEMFSFIDVVINK